MIHENFEVKIASYPDDNPGVVAEIWAGHGQLCEVRLDERGELLADIFACPGGGNWTVRLPDFVDCLNHAKQLLCEGMTEEMP